jgi:hypothetical protein
VIAGYRAPAMTPRHVARFQTAQPRCLSLVLPHGDTIDRVTRMIELDLEVWRARADGARSERTRGSRRQTTSQGVHCCGSLVSQTFPDAPARDSVYLLSKRSHLG